MAREIIPLRIPAIPTIVKLAIGSGSVKFNKFTNLAIKNQDRNLQKGRSKVTPFPPLPNVSPVANAFSKTVIQ